MTFGVNQEVVYSDLYVFPLPKHRKLLPYLSFQI
uniref:Uncharacterized protein n=1 Tax=Arundo donax TaxID=35708 RepID=A0A0A8YLW0_ARUDO